MKRLNLQGGETIAIFGQGPVGLSATQLAAGWQIGRKTFLTFSAGICTTGGATSYKNIGASFEYRFARGFRFLASFEPSASCTADQQTAPLTTNDRYQAGLDVLWEQEF
mgnify:CR=1 FL=1